MESKIMETHPFMNDIHKNVPILYYQTFEWSCKYPASKSKHSQLLIALLHVLEDIDAFSSKRISFDYSKIELLLKTLDVVYIHNTLKTYVLPSDLLTYLARIHHIRQILFQFF